MTRARTAILISGRGSNMMALVEAARAAEFPAEVVCVVSNRADAGGLAFAAANGIAAKDAKRVAASLRRSGETVVTLGSIRKRKGAEEQVALTGNLSVT